MNALIRKILNKRRRLLLIYTLLSVGLVWMFAAFYPSIRDEAEQFSELIQAYPEGLMKAFGINAESLFMHFESFLSVEYFSIMWPILAIILAISLGSAAIAQEVEEGTIELLLSQPLSRTKLFLAKTISDILTLSLFVITSIAVIAPLAYVYDIELRARAYIDIGIIGALFTIATYGIALCISSMASTRARVSSLSGGLYVLMYSLNMFSSFNESLESLRYLSFFHYYDFNAVLIDQTIPKASLWVFALIILVSISFGAIAFNRRDIAS